MAKGRIKVPSYWLSLMEDLSDEEVGVIFRILFANDLEYKTKMLRKLNNMSYEANRVFDICLEDVLYQRKHPRSFRKPEDVRAIRNSSDYCAWRASVYKRDFYTCQNCGAVGGKLNAHHIKPFAKYPDLRLDINNGITLCDKCHKLAHKRGFRYAE